MTRANATCLSSRHKSMSRSVKRGGTQGTPISRARTLYICCCHLTVMFLVKCKDAFSSTTVNPRKDVHRHKKGSPHKEGLPFLLMTTSREGAVIYLRLHEPPFVTVKPMGYAKWTRP